jgi:putative membrane protein
MGLAAYLVGTWLVHRLGGGRAFWGVLAGAWLLTAWDLVLDPAMAHESLRVKFWVWDEQGPYFGMPIKNFVGWVATGLIFMAISRCLWREDARINVSDLRLPAVVFVANMIFAMTISASVGLWIPILIAILVAGAPFALARYDRRFSAERPRLSLSNDR